MVKQVNYESLIDSINYYVTGHPRRPLLIWTHSLSDMGNVRETIAKIPGCSTVSWSLAETKSGKTVYAMEYPDGEFIPPKNTKGAQFFLYYLPCDQLKETFVRYAIDLMAYTKCPVVYIVNDRSKDENPFFDVSAFTQWDCICKREVSSDDTLVTASWWYADKGVIEARCRFCSESGERIEEDRPLLSLIYPCEHYDHREIEKIVCVDVEEACCKVYFFYLHARKGTNYESDLVAFFIEEDHLAPASVFYDNGKRVPHIRMNYF